MALVWLLWVGTSEWPVEKATLAIEALLVWMLFSKFIKLVTHFVRYPVDILLWPVSIIFGWLHGIIKFYAFTTLNEVCKFVHLMVSPLAIGLALGICTRDISATLCRPQHNLYLLSRS